jgi:hypothetical protein
MKPIKDFLFDVAIMSCTAAFLAAWYLAGHVGKINRFNK